MANGFCSRRKSVARVKIWAEKVVCELARRLSLPHIEYELAYESPVTRQFTAALLSINQRRLRLCF
ncbi:MAG: hypothetical protein BWX48_02152 [Verrucomicrobia bacterium ADurb.Bin006]|nr:MAG: hypothetical protein BWX48_02152 [Verrucomicrobia bacterium ADurb.Bin006]